MKKDLQAQFKVIIDWFLDNQISLDQLHSIMLELNPYSKDRKDIEHGWYIDWVNENIEAFKKGNSFVFVHCSSGSMFESFND